MVKGQRLRRSTGEAAWTAGAAVRAAQGCSVLMFSGVAEFDVTVRAAETLKAEGEG